MRTGTGERAKATFRNMDAGEERHSRALASSNQENETDRVSRAETD